MVRRLVRRESTASQTSSHPNDGTFRGSGVSPSTNGARSASKCRRTSSFISCATSAESLIAHDLSFSVPAGQPDRSAPLNRAAQAVLQRGARPEAEFALSPRYVQPAPGLAIGTGGVPADLSGEAGDADDHRRELPNRDLAAAAHVDGLRTVVPFCRQDDRLSGVLYVKEVAGGVAAAPGIDNGVPLPRRLQTAADQRRDHVGRGGIEVISGAVQVWEQEADGVEAVLAPVRLRLHDKHLLGQTVGRVGLLRITAP